MITIITRIFNIIFFIQKTHENYIINELIAKTVLFIFVSNNIKKAFFVLTHKINLFNIEQ